MAASRFQPPPLAGTPELSWVLARSFGPPSAAASGLRAGEALSLARDLAMCGRIVARTPADTLVAELGRDVADELRADHVLAVGQGMRIAELTREVASVAAETTVPLVLLKFAALQRSCSLLPGERDAGDLDALVERTQAESLASSLESRGFRRSTVPGWDHQLPALVHPRLGMVEIHVHLPGVRPPSVRGRFARLEDLSRLGALKRVEGLPGDVSVPTPEVVAAHALAHGIVQHGRAPASYPLLRMLTDLTHLPVSAGSVAPWLEGTLSGEEVEDTLRLVADLSRGLEVSGLDPSRPGDALLLHILAGTLDAAYRDSLTLGRVLDPLSERGRLVGLLAGLSRALFPSPAELGLLYPDLVARRGLLAARVYRPVDLLRRAARGLRPAVAAGGLW